jgi:hypothetical protein
MLLLIELQSTFALEEAAGEPGGIALRVDPPRLRRR